MSSKKYNRTFHLPWSEGASNDDKIAKDISGILNTEIVITEKLDGSNTSLELDGCFARTHSGPPTHASFDELKVLHASIKYKIPKGIQLFGEWLAAVHSIEYKSLPNYFMLFNVRDLNQEEPIWCAWDEVELWANEIDVPTVPVLFKGQVSNENEFKKLVESLMIQPSKCGGELEGVVVRIQKSFKDHEFNKCVMKMVIKNHVQTDTHWKHQQIKKNGLAI